MLYCEAAHSKQQVSMPFQKGQSGNPGGRPKVIGVVQDLARAHTPEAINTLAEIINDDKAPSAQRISAATALLDRGWGKPVQAVEANVGNKLEVIIKDATASALGTRTEAIDVTPHDQNPPIPHRKH
jgi:Family of unknown function (DUF5681)